MKGTIVFIHGMWDNGDVWREFKKPFEAAGYECLTPTLRHHTARKEECPDPRLGATSVADYVEDVSDIIKGLHDPIVIGWSLGGLVAQIVASRMRVKKVVLFSPAQARGTFYFNPSSTRPFLPLLVSQRFWSRAYLPPFRLVRNVLHNRLSDERARAAYDDFVHGSGRAFAEIAFWMFDRKQATKVDREKVECPLLFFVGTEDRMFVPSMIRKTAAGYGDKAEVRVVDGGGHSLPIEPGFEKVARDCLAWLDG